jgi:hypothetical protein
MDDDDPMVEAAAAEWVLRTTKAVAAAGQHVSAVHVRRKRGGKRVRPSVVDRALQVEVHVEGAQRQKFRCVPGAREVSMALCRSLSSCISLHTFVFLLALRFSSLSQHQAAVAGAGQ